MADDDTRDPAIEKLAHRDAHEHVPDSERRAADTVYSPSSERETEASQDLQRDDDDLREDGIDPDAVIAAPGTGGVDDAGDVEPDPKDLHLPWLENSND
jgi:hypothetical protein